MTCAMTRRWSVMRMPFLAHCSSRVSVWGAFSMAIGLVQIAGHHKGSGRLAVGPGVVALALTDLYKSQLVVEADRGRIVGSDFEDHAPDGRHHQILKAGLQQCFADALALELPVDGNCHQLDIIAEDAEHREARNVAARIAGDERGRVGVEKIGLDVLAWPAAIKALGME